VKGRLFSRFSFDQYIVFERWSATQAVHSFSCDGMLQRCVLTIPPLSGCISATSIIRSVQHNSNRVLILKQFLCSIYARKHATNKPAQEQSSSHAKKHTSNEMTRDVQDYTSACIPDNRPSSRANKWMELTSSDHYWLMRANLAVVNGPAQGTPLECKKISYPCFTSHLFVSS
jgi:hypothetical protein